MRPNSKKGKTNDLVRDYTVKCKQTKCIPLNISTENVCQALKREEEENKHFDSKLSIPHKITADMF